MRILLLALLLAGCHNDDRGPSCCASQPPPTREQIIELTLMLDKDGCKLYRFRDRGYYRYYTTCEGTVESSVPERVGKQTRERPDTITTSKSPR